MVIRTNQSARFTTRQMRKTETAVSKALEKLSSGHAINQASDDASGLAISEKMRAKITALNMAEVNVKDGMAITQTAHEVLQETNDMLVRMKELTLRSMSGINGSEEKQAMQNEIDQLVEEIDRISVSTNINGVYPLTRRFDKTGEIELPPVSPAPPTGGMTGRLETSLSTPPLKSDGSFDFNAVLEDSSRADLVFGEGTPAYYASVDRLRVKDPATGAVSQFEFQGKDNLDNISIKALPIPGSYSAPAAVGDPEV